MVCPFCLSAKTRIINSRPTSRLNQTWRRHKCVACGKLFTTRESIDLESVVSVLPANARKPVPYQKSKILFALLRACDHRTDIEHTAFWLLDTIEQELLRTAATTNNILGTKTIYGIVGRVLRQFDQVAHIKYVSANEHISNWPELKK